MTLDEKLDHFRTSVIDSATKQNIEIVEEYKAMLEKNYEARKDSALRKAEANYKMASDNIIRERNRRLSLETLDIRRMILDKTNEISNHIFNDVKSKLEEFMKTSQYEDLLCAQIMNAKNFAQGDDIIVYINPTDTHRISSIEEKTGVALTISNRDFYGGIRAVIPSRSILIDNSFSTKLDEEKSNFTL